MEFQPTEDIPFICRLISDTNKVTADIICGNPTFNAVLTPEGKSPVTFPISGRNFTLTDLDEDTDYEIFVTDSDGVNSTVRKFRTGYVHGNPMHYLHPHDNTFISSGHYPTVPLL